MCISIPIYIYIPLEEENNTVEKTRDRFKKIRDTKGTLHAKMGSIKDRNGMDLTKAEDIRRGGKNTQKIFFVQFFCEAAKKGGGHLTAL